MRLLVRCDGAPSVGMGHVVRSSALAEAIRSRGEAVEFAMRADRESGIAAVEAAEFRVHRIGSDEALAELAKAFDAIVVDSYEIDSALLARVASKTLLAVIDDEASRDLRSARWLLNQNADADRLEYALAQGATLLLGPRYALLRGEFAAARAQLHRSFHRDDAKLLVTCGGGDVERYVVAVLHALEEADRQLDVFVLGLQSVSFRSRHRVRCERRQGGIAELMAWCDAAVSAAGSTCWELCCMQVPSIAFPIARNQRVVAEGLNRAGAMCVLESFDEGIAQLPHVLTDLLQNPERRRSLALRAGELIDGAGASRAAESLCGLTARS